MRTVAAGEAATLRDLAGRRKVYRRDEFPILVDATLAEKDYELGVQRILYDQDTTLPHSPGWVPETVLVVTVNRGWGAAYFRARDEAGQGWAWITHDPQSVTDAPELLFDPEAGANYPPGAAIPVGELRRAIEEYLRTGERPTCVQWREAERYMIY